MAPTRAFRATALIASGLAGIASYFVGERYHLPFMPVSDFARGLWFGLCLGAELIGGFLLIRAKTGSKSAD